VVILVAASVACLPPAPHAGRAALGLVEKEARYGGHARTDETQGFHFDRTGHWLHLRDEA